VTIWRPDNRAAHHFGPTSFHSDVLSPNMLCWRHISQHQLESMKQLNYQILTKQMMFL